MAAAGNGSSELDTRGRYKTEAQAVEAVKVLLAAGADINSRDHNGQTALYGAATWGWNDLVKTLAAQQSGSHGKDPAAGRPPISPWASAGSSGRASVAGSSGDRGTAAQADGSANTPVRQQRMRPAFFPRRGSQPAPRPSRRCLDPHWARSSEPARPHGHTADRPRCSSSRAAAATSPCSIRPKACCWSTAARRSGRAEVLELVKKRTGSKRRSTRSSIRTGTGTRPARTSRWARPARESSRTRTRGCG